MNRPKVRTIVLINVVAGAVLMMMLGSVAFGQDYVGEEAPPGPAEVGTPNDVGPQNDVGSDDNVGTDVLGEQFAQVGDCACALPWWVPVGLIGLTALMAGNWFLLLGLLRRKKEEEQEATANA